MSDEHVWNAREEMDEEQVKKAPPARDEAMAIK